MSAVHPSWDDIEAAVTSQPSSPSRPTSARPRTWRSNDCDLTDLGPERLDDYIQVIQCGECNKPVLARYEEYHRANCQLVRDIRDGRASPSLLDSDRSRRKRAISEISDTPSQTDTGAYGSASSSVSPQKKLTKKAARALEVEERRMARLEKKARKLREAEEAKSNRRRRGQALDVNRQCGVLNDNGQPCLRSLTCKTHSMGSKRSVQGRSKSYDDLLLEWQKANNPAFLAKLEKKEEEKAARAEEMRRSKKFDLKNKKKLGAKRRGEEGGDLTTLQSKSRRMNFLLNGLDGRGGGLFNPDGSRRTYINLTNLVTASSANAKGEGTSLIANEGEGTSAGAAGNGVPSTTTSLLSNLLDEDDPYLENDLAPHSTDSSRVRTELQALLVALRARSADERVAPIPLARRTHHGLHTAQARRFLLIRQAFGAGSTAAGAGLAGAAGGVRGISGGGGGSADGGGGTAGAGTGGSSRDSGFRPPPIVAGGGWGLGMFASHS